MNICKIKTSFRGRFQEQHPAASQAAEPGPRSTHDRVCGTLVAADKQSCCLAHSMRRGRVFFHPAQLSSHRRSAQVIIEAPEKLAKFKQCIIAATSMLTV